MSTGTLDVWELSRHYGATVALDNATFSASANEIVAITGPSGAGKSTICRLISGLTTPDRGRITLAGTEITRASPQVRDVAYMFESYALYPHLTVFENIASPLRSPRQKGHYDAASIDLAVSSVLALAEIAEFEHRLPRELSGGQKQRVALCRTLVQTPRLHLLDEPISHLDAKLRHTLRGTIRRKLAKSGVPTLWFTPDAVEALSVGDKVIVLAEGQIQQQGSPEEIFLKPANTTVARLVGDPAMNILSGQFEDNGSAILFRHEAGGIELSKAQTARVRKLANGHDYLLGVRPNDLGLSHRSDKANGLSGEIYTVEPFGKYSIVAIKFGHEFLKIKTKKIVEFGVGEAVSVELKATDHIIFNAETGKAL